MRTFPEGLVPLATAAPARIDAMPGFVGNLHACGLKLFKRGAGSQIMEGGDLGRGVTRTREERSSARPGCLSPGPSGQAAFNGLNASWLSSVRSRPGFLSFAGAR